MGEHRAPEQRSRDDRLESGLRGLHEHLVTGSAPHGVGAGPLANNREKPTTLTTTMIIPRPIDPRACVPARRNPRRGTRATTYINEHRINAKSGPGPWHSYGSPNESKLLAPGEYWTNDPWDKTSGHS